MDGEDFEDIGEAFEKENEISIGKIGEATIRLMNQRELVDFAVGWMEKNR